MHDLRLNLAQQFPGVTFAFLPADIVSQILNFGLPAPLDIQVAGNDLEGDRRYANKLLLQKFAKFQARRICAFSSPLTSRICTSMWTGRKRTRSDSRSTMLRKICWSHSAGVSRPRQHSGSIPRTGELFDRDADPAVSNSKSAGCREHSRDRNEPGGSARDPGESGIGHAAGAHAGRFALRHSAGDRHLWVGARARPGRRRATDQSDHHR